jgi:hypothetical protein
MPNELSRKIVQIKKDHRCFGCVRKFSKDTLMEKTDYADEGTVYSIYNCLTCQGILLYTQNWNEMYEGLTEGCVKDIMECDNFKDTPEEYLRKLSTELMHKKSYGQKTTK